MKFKLNCLLVLIVTASGLAAGTSESNEEDSKPSEVIHGKIAPLATTAAKRDPVSISAGKQQGVISLPAADKIEHPIDDGVEHLLQDAKEIADSSVGFWHAFVASISVIIVSELGDKTFFIAAILAMRYSRLTVFAGAISALGLMTALSAFLGYATQIIPRKLTFYISTFLFLIFGLKMLKEGYGMSDSEGQHEFEEAQDEIKKKEDSLTSDFSDETDRESGIVRTRRPMWAVLLRFVSKIFVESFTLTFLAEWGDRSQLTTIILAARENVIGVVLGGTLGHAMCTGIAVLGGRMIAQRISIRTVTLIGGVVFILFALSALVFHPEES